jgi:ATP-dependent DNA helicase RecQ
LGRFRRRIGSPQTIALTATATRIVREDIAQVLELRGPATFVSGFARDNLALQVETPASNAEKDARVVEYVTQASGSGIVYAATRKSCEHLVELIQAHSKRSAAFYHAGMEPEQRKRIQDMFMADQLPLIVATNAFGMGIDKRELRFVVHYNLPGSIEAYYQEAGRAGRDGQPAECVLLYSYQDRFIQEFFIENAYPTREIVRDVFELLKSYETDPIELTLQEIKEELQTSIGTEGIRVCETLLEKAGAIERLDSHRNLASIRIDLPHDNLPEILPRDARAQRAVLRGLEALVGDLRGERVYFSPQRLADSVELKLESVNRAIRELVKLNGIDYVPPFRGRAIHVLRRDWSFEQLQIDFDELERRKKSEFDKLDQMVRFAQSRRCRQLEILEYFGDADRRICRRCDNCAGAAAPIRQTAQLTEIGAARVWYAVQVALSGAARTHGRIGKQLLVQMLSGSGSKKLKPLRLDRLPTFGRLKQLRQEAVADLVSALLGGGWLVQVEPTRFRPVVQISDEARRLLHAEPDSGVLAAIPPDLALEIAQVLTEIEAPPERTVQTPHVAQALAPAAKGHALPVASRALAKGQREVPRSTRGGESDELSVSPDDSRPDYYWTWRLFADGYAASAVESIRRVSREQLAADLESAARHGLPIQAKWLEAE